MEHLLLPLIFLVTGWLMSAALFSLEVYAVSRNETTDIVHKMAAGPAFKKIGARPPIVVEKKDKV